MDEMRSEFVEMPLLAPTEPGANDLPEHPGPLFYFGHCPDCGDRISATRDEVAADFACCSDEDTCGWCGSADQCAKPEGDDE